MRNEENCRHNSDHHPFLLDYWHCHSRRKRPAGIQRSNWSRHWHYFRRSADGWAVLQRSVADEIVGTSLQTRTPDHSCNFVLVFIARCHDRNCYGCGKQRRSPSVYPGNLYGCDLVSLGVCLSQVAQSASRGRKASHRDSSEFRIATDLIPPAFTFAFGCLPMWRRLQPV